MAPETRGEPQCGRLTAFGPEGRAAGEAGRVGSEAKPGGEVSAPLRIVVPWDAAKTSLNARLHWRERRRRNQAAKERARLAWILAGRPVLDVACDVTLIVRRGRCLDADNALSGAKSCCDALFNRRRTGEGVLPDDGPGWVRWVGIEQETGARWRGREEVEFVIVPRAEEER